MVGEADVLRDRVPSDPRLHVRRDAEQHDVALPLLVRGVITTAVRSVEPRSDVADLARLFVDGHLRSVPVVEDGVVVGIASRRDVLRLLIRPDDEIRADVLRLVEGYTGDLGCWDARVTEGVTTVRRTKGAPEVARSVAAYRGGFLPIPYLPEQSARVGGAPSMSLDDIVRGIEIVLTVSAARQTDLHTVEGRIS